MLLLQMQRSLRLGAKPLDRSEMSRVSKAKTAFLLIDNKVLM